MADPAKTEPTGLHLKPAMPFCGVMLEQRRAIQRQFVREFHAQGTANAHDAYPIVVARRVLRGRHLIVAHYVSVVRDISGRVAVICLERSTLP